MFLFLQSRSALIKHIWLSGILSLQVFECVILVFVAEPYSEYKIWIRAYTLKNEGKPSEPLISRTDVVAPGQPIVVNLTCQVRKCTHSYLPTKMSTFFWKIVASIGNIQKNIKKRTVSNFLIFYRQMLLRIPRIVSYIRTSVISQVKLPK